MKVKEATEYILGNFIRDDLFEKVSMEYELTETEDGGASYITWQCSNKENRCIANFDKKSIELPFLKPDKRYHLRKCVDHVIFESNEQEKWTIHLIEMKTGIEHKDKWNEIKGKFRASYFTIKAIAAVLDLEIENFYFYTTYEHATLMNKPENLVSRTPHTGEAAIRPEDEWTGDKFGLNIGKRIPFKHTPIKMKRDVNGNLVREHNKSEI
jgi:hypothetical protein